MGLFEKLMRKNPTDRGKRGAKINLMVDERGAPISVVLTGANRHDKVSAIELIVSMFTKRPAHKEQHLCADKAYDADDLREFAASVGYITHITPVIDPNGHAIYVADLKQRTERQIRMGRRVFL